MFFVLLPSAANTFKTFKMIRTVITPNQNVLSFNVPDKYIGKKGRSDSFCC